MDISSAGLGQRPDLDAELAALGEPEFAAARVLAQHRGFWLVAEPGAEPRLVPARGRLRDEEAGSPVTGDWVALDPEGSIAAIFERRGVVIRRAAGTSTDGQVLAANVDTALVVEASPEPNVERAERLAALASAGGVPVVLVLTKADLDDDSMEVAQRIGRRLGLADTVAVSAQEGDGLGVLQSLLTPGTTAVLLGLSGAGKSTLANALLGIDRQATAPVREGDGRGRHTTVTRELLLLPNGALLIDTPGIREAGMWDGTGDSFADIDALAAECQFNDCSHTVEPGCAVLAKADPERLAAWQKLAREQKWVDDRRAAARDREQRGKAYRDVQREARRVKGDE